MSVRDFLQLKQLVFETSIKHTRLTNTRHNRHHQECESYPLSLPPPVTHTPHSCNFFSRNTVWCTRIQIITSKHSQHTSWPESGGQWSKGRTYKKKRETIRFGNFQLQKHTKNKASCSLNITSQQTQSFSDGTLRKIQIKTTLPQSRILYFDVSTGWLPVNN